MKTQLKNNENNLVLFKHLKSKDIVEHFTGPNIAINPTAKFLI